MSYAYLFKYIIIGDTGPPFAPPPHLLFAYACCVYAAFPERTHAQLVLNVYIKVTESALENVFACPA